MDYITYSSVRPSRLRFCDFTIDRESNRASRRRTEERLASVLHGKNAAMNTNKRKVRIVNVLSRMKRDRDRGAGTFGFAGGPRSIISRGFIYTHKMRLWEICPCIVAGRSLNSVLATIRKRGNCRRSTERAGVYVMVLLPRVEVNIVGRGYTFSRFHTSVVRRVPFSRMRIQYIGEYRNLRSRAERLFAVFTLKRISLVRQRNSFRACAPNITESTEICESRAERLSAVFVWTLKRICLTSDREILPSTVRE